MDTGVRRAAFAAGALVVSTAAWTVILGRGLTVGVTGASIVLIAVSLWVSAVVSVTGILVARARWARRLGLVTSGGHGIVALLAPVDVWWGVAAVLTAVTAVAIAGPWLDGVVRGRPSASGPPARVVLIALGFLWVPFAIGVAGGDGWPAVSIGLSALAAAYWFIRALPGALLVVRVVWPLLAVALAVPLGLPAGIVAAAYGVAIGAIAWHSSVRTSLHPLVESGTRVPIPPELAPKEVLDAADIDDRGRPR